MDYFGVALITQLAQKPLISDEKRMEGLIISLPSTFWQDSNFTFRNIGYIIK
jgi:hypothetical protein